jgi:hypothetical protein
LAIRFFPEQPILDSWRGFSIGGRLGWKDIRIDSNSEQGTPFIGLFVLLIGKLCKIHHSFAISLPIVG